MSFRVVIPARFASSRLPGKPLADIAGKPMIQHVYQRAVESEAIQAIVAADDDRIVNACRDFGADVRMTAAEHESGTDRIGEVCELEGWSAQDIVVNLQSDEPLMPPGLIRQVASLIEENADVEMATLACPIGNITEFLDPHVVKVILNSDSDAICFSRAPIPWNRDADQLSSQEDYQGSLRHLGIYAYRVAALLQLTAAGSCRLEAIERLEQLRALWNGIRIRVGLTEEPPGPGVDTSDDLDIVRALIGDD